MRLFRQNLFKDHPYHFTVLGEENSVSRIRRKDITRFYKEYCVPANTVMAIFGDVERKEIIPKIKTLFKGFKGRMPKRLAKPTPRIRTKQASSQKIMDKEQLLIIAGFKTIKITDSERYAFSVLSSILSGSDGRLFYDVRDKLGISYTQGVASVPGLDDGYFLFYIATSKEHLSLGKDIITDEIKRLLSEPVTEEELELAKRDLIGGKLRGIQSVRSLAFEAGLDELYGLGYDNFRKFSSNIEAVTQKDIERIVKKYFDLENLTVVTLGPLQDKD
jgi:zinc protease